MLNTSINSTSAAFTFSDCVEKDHFGSIMSHIAMLFCGLLGTPVFLCFLWRSLPLQTGRKFKPTQVFHVNILLVNLLFCIHISITFLYTFVFKNITAFYISKLLFGLTWFCRPLIQTCLCFELYLAVLYPVTFLRYKSIQYRIASAAVAWLMASGYSIFLIFSWITFPDYIFISVFLIGLTMISYFCVSVLHALKHPWPGDTQIIKDIQSDVRNQQKRNTFKTISSVLLTVLFSYLPLVSLSIFNFIKIDKELLDCDITPFMKMFTYCSVLIPALLKLNMESHPECINKRKGVKDTT